MNGATTVAALLDRITLLEQQLAAVCPPGCPLWSKRIGATSSDVGRGVTVDGSGNVVVTGVFQGTVDFGGGGGGLTSAGVEDIFLLKLLH